MTHCGRRRADVSTTSCARIRAQNAASLRASPRRLLTGARVIT